MAHPRFNQNPPAQQESPLGLRRTERDENSEFASLRVGVYSPTKNCSLRESQNSQVV